MDISGVMNTASQASKYSASNPAAVTVQKKVADVAVESVGELLKSVVQETQKIPTEKLPANLGRNLDVTA